MLRKNTTKSTAFDRFTAPPNAAPSNTPTEKSQGGYPPALPGGSAKTAEKRSCQATTRGAAGKKGKNRLYCQTPMGSTIPPLPPAPGPYGDDFDGGWPPGQTPKYCYLDITGVEMCEWANGWYGGPNGRWLLTQSPGNPGVWSYFGQRYGDHWWSAELRYRVGLNESQVHVSVYDDGFFFAEVTGLFVRAFSNELICKKEMPYNCGSGGTATIIFCE